MAGKLGYKGVETGLAAALSGGYLMLLTAAPSGAGAALSSLSEYSAAGYSRMSVSFGAATGTPRTAANASVVSTSPLSGADGMTAITHWALVSVASGTAGDLLAYGEVSGADTTPDADEVVIFASGALTISID